MGYDRYFILVISDVNEIIFPSRIWSDYEMKFTN